MTAPQADPAPANVDAAKVATPNELFQEPPNPTAHVVDGPAGRDVPGVEQAEKVTAATPSPAPAVTETPAETPAEVLPPKMDRRGNPFDPEKHIETMHPKTGAWMPRKPKREKADGASLGRMGPEIDSPRLASDDEMEGSDKPQSGEILEDMPGDPFAVAAVAACTILYSVGMTIGGDEWRPSKDEHAQLSTSFEGYFRAKGIKDLSPGWALGIALVAYAGPRFRKPKTVSTLQKIGGGLKRFAQWFRSRRTAHAIENAAPSAGGIQP